ncbi:MAG TPA: hypothetical protein VGO80_01720 [Solirubrobacteraceae bacterium]|jgi:hypothetical protein|nr:hypothetical protein [Solirubrobacteraceae bacterium]
MAAREYHAIELDDDEGGRLNAIWSGSGKRLIVTVARRGARAQVELRPEQVDALAAFLVRQRL